jgi:hypothetical protein
LEQFLFKQFWKYKLLQNLKNIKFDRFSKEKENKKRKSFRKKALTWPASDMEARTRSEETVKGPGPPNSRKLDDQRIKLKFDAESAG